MKSPISHNVKQKGQYETKMVYKKSRTKHNGVQSGQDEMRTGNAENRTHIYQDTTNSVQIENDAKKKNIT